MPSTHALLSPSAAHRWLHCTPSAALAAKVEDRGSSYAEEGTCAHALCELLLLQYLNRDCTQAMIELNVLRGKWYNEEMQEAADLYVSIVLDKWKKAQATDQLARIFVERRLDFSAYAPESFGTADCIILANGCMEVIDFKYGKGVEVSAQENPQMMIYALGAVDEFSLDYDFTQVCMTIIQPRLGNVSEYLLLVAELLDWGKNTLRPAAEAAFNGEGEQVPGDHCRFCPIKPTCAALALKAVQTWQGNADVRQLRPDNIGEVLKLIPMIEQWATAVKDHALALALDGNTPEGFKLVEGRSMRVITDPAALADALMSGGFPAESIYKPRELQTITSLEKLVGKKQFSALAEPYIEKPAGKPTLAPITDKRQAIVLDPAASAAADFKDIEP